MSRNDELFPKTTFFGGKSKTTAAKMAANIPEIDGFHRRKRLNPDGSETTLTTKGGMPRVITEKNEEKEDILIPDCAAIPVCSLAPYGFKKAPSLIPLGHWTEEHPSSALLAISNSAKATVQWNKLYAKTNNTTKPHPGNRMWFDSRPKEIRGFNSVVSWWCPIWNTSMADVCASDDDGTPSRKAESVWAGEPFAYAQLWTGTNIGPYATTFDATKGHVFIDGKFVWNFDKYVLAAAVATVDGVQYLRVVVADSILRRYPRGLYSYSAVMFTQGRKILTLNLSSNEVVEHPQDIGEWTAQSQGGGGGGAAAITFIPTFSPDGNELLYAWPQGFSYNAGTGDVSYSVMYAKKLSLIPNEVTTLGETYIAHSDGSSTAFQYTLSAWFLPDGTPKFLVRHIFDDRETVTDKLVVTNDVLFASLDGLKTKQGIYTATYPSAIRPYPLEGTPFTLLADDGQGAFFFTTTTVTVPPTLSNLWQMWDLFTETGVQETPERCHEAGGEILLVNSDSTYTRYAVPEVRVPHVFLVDGGTGNRGGSENWWHYIPGDYRGAYRNALRLRIAFAVSPDRKRVVVGAGVIEQVQKARQDSPLIEFVESALHAYCASHVMVLGPAVANGVGEISYRSAKRLWDGDYQLLNSPVFFMRAQKSRKAST